MEFGGDLFLSESEVVLHGILRQDGIVVGADEEGGRCLFGHLEFAGEECGELFVLMIGEEVSAGAGVSGGGGEGDDGIDQDLEIGPCAGFTDRVFGEGLWFIVVGGEGGCEVATRGEAHDPDFLGVDTPGFGIEANGAEGVLGVLEGDGVFVLAVTVFEDCGRDAALIEPLGDFVALVIDGEEPVGAARADDDGGAGCLIGFREEDAKGWDVHVFDMSGVVDDFGLGELDGSGRVTGPELEGKGVLRQGERCGGEEGERCEEWDGDGFHNKPGSR